MLFLHIRSTLAEAAPSQIILLEAPLAHVAGKLQHMVALRWFAILWMDEILHHLRNPGMMIHP